MKVVQTISCREYSAQRPRARVLLRKVCDAGKCEELEMLLDMWAPHGFTQEGWDSFLTEHYDHILNKLMLAESES